MRALEPERPRIYLQSHKRIIKHRRLRIVVVSRLRPASQHATTVQEGKEEGKGKGKEGTKGNGIGSHYTMEKCPAHAKRLPPCHLHPTAPSSPRAHPTALPSPDTRSISPGPPGSSPSLSTTTSRSPVFGPHRARPGEAAPSMIELTVESSRLR